MTTHSSITMLGTVSRFADKLLIIRVMTDVERALSTILPFFPAGKHSGRHDPTTELKPRLRQVGTGRGRRADRLPNTPRHLRELLGVAQQGRPDHSEAQRPLPDRAGIARKSGLLTGRLDICSRPGGGGMKGSPRLVPGLSGPARRPGPCRARRRSGIRAPSRPPRVPPPRGP